MKSQAPQRSLRSLKLTAHLHWQFMGLGLLLCIAFACAVTVTVIILFQMQSDLSYQLSPELAESMLSAQRDIQFLFMAQLALFLGGIAASLVLAAHRIAGPHIAMKRTCNAIRAGKTDTRLKFRRYDNLRDVEECFNAMVDSLVSGREPATAAVPPRGESPEQSAGKSAAKKGLTLVEIMIVVFIIGLIATIAIPAFLRPRERTRQTLCINNLRLIDQAKQMWAGQEGKQDSDTPLAEDLDSYIKGGTSALRCPSGGRGLAFEAYYSIGTVGEEAECLILPATHHL